METGAAVHNISSADTSYSVENTAPGGAAENTEDELFIDPQPGPSGAVHLRL